MKIIKTDFEGLKIVKLEIYKDKRGFFVERFNEKILKKHGIEMHCMQVNHSFSTQNVIRGLHFQNNPAQKKLIGIISGRIIDIVVDIRPNSITFGKHFKIKIENPDVLLFIPEGFAHGFSVVSKEGTNFIYAIEGIYNKESECGLIYNDKDLGINWEVENPIVSEKDLVLQTFLEYKKNLFM